MDTFAFMGDLESMYNPVFNGTPIDRSALYGVRYLWAPKILDPKEMVDNPDKHFYRYIWTDSIWNRYFMKKSIR